MLFSAVYVYRFCGVFAFVVVSTAARLLIFVVLWKSWQLYFNFYDETMAKHLWPLNRYRAEQCRAGDNLHFK